MAKVLRLLKTGGCSYCSSPEELVGKGRCNHIPGMCFNMEQENGMTFVEIESLNGSKKGVPNTKVDTDKLDEYTKQIDKELTEEKKNKILNFYKTFKG